METVDEIIDALGGTSAVAAAMEPKLTPSTVHSWREVNFIPVWRQPAILALADEKNIAPGTIAFPTAEQRRSRVAAEPVERAA